MKYLFSVLLISAVSSGEVLWDWDFDEIPSGWEANQYWDFSDSGAHSYVESGALELASQTSEMFSDTLTIPSSVTLITVSLVGVSDYDGWYSTGESELSQTAQILPSPCDRLTS